MSLLNLLTKAEITADQHKFINYAGECRKAAMETATGKTVGFYGPTGHKQSARGFLQAARVRRLHVEERNRNVGFHA